MAENASPGKMGVRRSFRLRPVDTTGRNQRRYAYLRAPCIRFVTLLQLLMGHITIIAQIMILCTSRKRYEDDLFGSGIGMGMIQILASIFTLMAAEDPVYSWLHLGMTFNILSAVGFYILAFYIMWYPIASFLDQEQIHGEKTEKTANPYIAGEVDSLTTYMYIIVISSVASCAIGIFLAICTGRPVCCGYRQLAAGGVNTDRRKGSRDNSKSPSAEGITDSLGNRYPTKLELRRNHKFKEKTGTGDGFSSISIS